MQRHLRLRRQDDFDRLRTTGHVWRHPFFILSVAPNALAHNRYGFVTSKRLGSAVVRNRIRRMLREAVRRAHPQLRPGHDIAFIARAPVIGQSFQAIEQAVTDNLRRAGLWMPPPGEQDP